ncbi:uncharacterized protein FIBRA_05675 [Fibroporia radiculosa]|uniref:Bud22 domain-containing protein n=1 Tax=Fibroporia radiculosa TaxID=599839 RepID=J4IAU9_9APHY|nr:uncharacterized protein FIBRA_05675 [Fibroporia radiculosa]CCM03541.1 predicted protein [Fibroporia radiculosa]
MPTIQSARGTKRKRAPETEQYFLKQEDLAQVLSGKLHHGIKEVRKAAKKARTFETRKLVQKIKSLRTKDPVANRKLIEDHETQLEAVKRLNHDAIANQALRTKLHKDRILSGSTHIQTAVGVEFPPHVLLRPSASRSVAAKVETRLLSSKIVAAEINAVLLALRETLNPGSKKLQVDATETHDDDTVHLPKPGDTKSHVRAIDSDEESSGSHDAQEQGLGWESESVEGGDPGDGWESGSIDDSRIRIQDTSSNDGSDDDGDEDFPHPSESPAHSDALVIDSMTRKAATSVSTLKDAKDKAKSRGESTFLPSLSVGFTRGDSDASDWSDGEANIADGGRKNRRGQRARRAIWEKKYGKNANHVKKGREAVSSTHASRTSTTRVGHKDPHVAGAPRNASASSAKPAFKAPASDNGWSKNTQIAATAPPAQVTARRTDDKPLHPSWEAKRKLKEKMNPSILPPQGQKIVF